MIEVRDLEVKYPGSEANAVDKVSFRVGQGQFFSLVGPSGCGKTTTLRAIAGLELPDSGKIIIKDTEAFSSEKNLNVPVHKRGIGMVFQSYAIWPHLSVFENVAFPLTLKKMKKEEVRRLVEEALETVGLQNFFRRDATMLSGGQQQRLALARALVSKPKILLLDEPLSNLDAKLREQMRVEIRGLQQRLGITTLYVTHDQEEALSMSDMIAVMDQGRIVQLGVPEDIYHQPNNDFVAHFIGNTNLLYGQWRDGKMVFPWGELVVHSIRTGNGWTYVAVRPEDIMLSHNESDLQGDAIVGEVISLMFMGQYYDCRVRISPECTIRVHIKQSGEVCVGENVQLHFNKDRIQVVQSQPTVEV
ncbi:ABC transporter ATP-binding protein [Cohnella kolymensis]|uniref:ABC transporter ATP-binding protein n=1 Tax=Cohnella kolymensis TaxID=1590652 RepID=UPI0006984FED|nr:ABC transporter ATP-binding protein [Cohnella kolymensis]